MAINKVMRATLKALSYPDIDLKKNYKIERTVERVTKKNLLKPFFKTWDYEIELDNHKIPVRVFLPKDENKAEGLLVFFHGGGWVSGNIETYDRVCTEMAFITNYKVLAVDYRLAPESPFPKGLDDCYKVTQEILFNSKLWNIPFDKVVLIGDSAGANLVAAVSLMSRDKGALMPKKQILIYPAVNNDFSENSEFDSIRSNGKEYLLTSKKLKDYMELYKSKEEDLNNPYFAPLMTKNYTNQPDTLLITAEFDPLRDEGEEYGKRLKAGLNYVGSYRIPDALHGFFSLPARFPQVKKTYELINKFLKGR